MAEKPSATAKAPRALPFNRIFVMELVSFPVESRPTIAASIIAEAI